MIKKICFYKQMISPLGSVLLSLDFWVFFYVITRLGAGEINGITSVISMFPFLIGAMVMVFCI